MAEITAEEVDALEAAMNAERASSGRKSPESEAAATAFADARRAWREQEVAAGRRFAEPAVVVGAPEGGGV